MKVRLIRFSLAAAVLAAGALLLRAQVPDFAPAFAEQTRAPAIESGFALQTAPFAGGLSHPWGMELLPDGSWLVSERPGRLRLISADGAASEPVAGLPEVLAQRQGGLLDVAADPAFADSRVIYWSYAKPLEGGHSATAVARGVLSPDAGRLADVRDIFVQDPPSPTAAHYGSRLAFDGAGHLFITTGEHFTPAERQLAQDLGTSYGKVIRVLPDGSVPADNPFATGGGLGTIWSYGHRNLQGAAIDPASGRLWTLEHGPRGGDELNHPEPGRNYGWPVISYGINYNGTAVGEGISAREGMEQPVYYWDPVIAPSGMVFYQGAMFPEWQGSLLIGSLTPGGLVRLTLDGDRITGEERLLPDLGRVRDVAVAPDGALMVLIDDDDGAVMRISRAP